jgi:hypothetical protein
MEGHLIALKTGLACYISIVGCVSAHAQTTTQLPAGCNFGISIHKAYEFVDSQMAEYAERSEAILADVQSLKYRVQRPDVIVPGVPKGEALTRDDNEKLTELKRQFVSISAKMSIMSNYKRDIQVVAETYRVTRLADLHGISKEDLADTDPRKFYFEILQRLRVSQPVTSRTPQLRQETNCDLEAGLYLEEELTRRRLGKAGDFRFRKTADVKGLVNLISDIERLRNLYELSRNLLTRGIADVPGTLVPGEPSNSIGSYIAASNAEIQSMHSTIVPYIDQQFPSDWSLEQGLWHREK